MIFGAFYSVILWVWGELHDFWVFYSVILLVWGEPRDFLGHFTQSHIMGREELHEFFR